MDSIYRKIIKTMLTDKFKLQVKTSQNKSNNLMMHISTLDKQEQNKSQHSRLKEICRKRTETNQRKMKQNKDQ